MTVVPTSDYVPAVFDNVDVLLYDATYTVATRLSGWVDGAFQNVVSDVGAWSLNTVLASPGTEAALAANDGRIIIRVNGAEEFRGLLEPSTRDRADEQGPLGQVSLGGRSILGILDRGQVRGPAGELSGPRTFTNYTPGRILHVLIGEAQARGCFPEISIDFTDSNDSSGAPWAQTLTISYNAGTPLTDVVAQLTQGGFCEVTTQASIIQCFNPDGALAVDNPNAILRPARDAQSDPVQHDRSPVKNVILAGGDTGTAVEVTDAASIARYGRREGFISQSGTTDHPTLTQIGNAQLALLANPAEGYTYQWDATTPHSLDPFKGSFNLGDYIRHDQVWGPDANLMPLRVRSIAFQFDETTRQFSVELNTILLDAEVALQKALTALQARVQALSG